MHFTVVREEKCIIQIFFPSSLTGLFLWFLFVLFLFFPVAVMHFSYVNLTDDGIANL